MEVRANGPPLFHDTLRCVVSASWERCSSKDVGFIDASDVSLPCCVRPSGVVIPQEKAVFGLEPWTMRGRGRELYREIDAVVGWRRVRRSLPHLVSSKAAVSIDCVRHVGAWISARRAFRFFKGDYGAVFRIATRFLFQWLGALNQLNDFKGHFDAEVLSRCLCVGL